MKFDFRNKIVAATPLLCVFAFLLLGFGWNLWHPGWMVFLMIPVMPYLVGKKQLRVSIPLLITIIYLILGFGWNLWHPGWIIFILIPVFEIFFGKHPFEKEIVIENKKDDCIDVE